uniref:Uncharacterized protein n=1 Tax=Glossina palpalis gambiensis TaxID=67801 RepID=A0A1B0B0L9_9MUSC
MAVHGSFVEQHVGEESLFCSICFSSDSNDSRKSFIGFILSTRTPKKFLLEAFENDFNVVKISFKVLEISADGCSMDGGKVVAAVTDVTAGVDVFSVGVNVVWLLSTSVVLPS